MGSEMCIRDSPRIWQEAVQDYKIGMSFDDILIKVTRRIFPEGVTDATGEAIEVKLGSLLGYKPGGVFGTPQKIPQPQSQYWTGGEVGKGDPEEGDSPPNVKGGQGVIYKNGQWVYKKSGKPAQEWVVTRINKAIQDIGGAGEKEAEAMTASEQTTQQSVEQQPAAQVEQTHQDL